MTIIQHDNEVIAVARYAGKNVRAVAKCNMNEDKFDLEFGKNLAIARLNHKIAIKKYKNAKNKFAAIKKIREVVLDRESKMAKYVEDAEKEVFETEDILNNCLTEK